MGVTSIPPSCPGHRVLRQEVQASSLKQRAASIKHQAPSIEQQAASRKQQCPHLQLTLDLWCCLPRHSGSLFDLCQQPLQFARLFTRCLIIMHHASCIMHLPDGGAFCNLVAILTGGDSIWLLHAWRRLTCPLVTMYHMLLLITPTSYEH